MKTGLLIYAVLGNLAVSELPRHIMLPVHSIFLFPALKTLLYAVQDLCPDKYFSFSAVAYLFILIFVVFPSAEVCKICWLEKGLSTGC